MGWPCIWLLVLLLTEAAFGGCPRECRCDLDVAGRRVMTCDRGGIDNLSTMLRGDINSLWEVIYITAPPHQPNKLQIGPVFQRYRSLKELHITHSNIPALGAETFRGMLQLRLLRLSFNKLTHLRRLNFFGMLTLTHLYLDHNLIQTITSATFRHLEDLSVLDLSHNKINGLVPRMFYGVEDLKELDLSGNPLTDLEVEVFEDTPRLEILRCSRCEIRIIEPALLMRIPRLLELDLSFNYLINADGNIFKHVPKLKTLNLNGNQLTHIPDNFLTEHAMTSVGLGRNQIESIGSYAFYNTTIFSMDLSFNSFHFTRMGANGKKQGFTGNTIRSLYRTLKSIDLSGNNFKPWQLQEFISPMQALEKLTLTDLQLVELPDSMFEAHYGLLHLNLSRNYIPYIPTRALAPLVQLNVLDLSFNDIRGASAESLAAFDEVQPGTKVYFQGNPFACDRCYIPDFARWLNKQRQFRMACEYRDSKNCLTCKSPYSLYGTVIQSLDLYNLPECGAAYSDRNRMGASSALWISMACILLILLGVAGFAALIFYNRHSAQYYTNEDKRTYEDLSSLNNEDAINGNAYPEKKPTVATIEEITVLKGEPKLNGKG